MNKSFKYIFSFLLSFQSIFIFGQKKPEFLTDYNQKWVDSVFNTLTLEEKIGQLLMPRGNVGFKGYTPEKLKMWVEKYKIGGLVFFGGQPSVQAGIVNQLQAVSKVPMLIGVDMEWGMAMRLDSTVRFPYQMALGAMPGGEDLIYRMGQEVARQSKRIGIHVNYAPVVDINNNPKNPVINFRSFGEDKMAVSNKALAYMMGMQSQKLLTTAKHFPGHGDTGVDSHYDLPVISHDKKHLSENELFPFKYLINNGLSGVMTAHLSIPSLDNTPNLASTFSTNIVSDLLRKELGFEGLTFTDAMDMQGAVKYFPNGEALVKAILAGNDILETFEDVPLAVEAIKAAIDSKKLPIEILDQRVKKILKAKSWVGLDNYKPIKLEGLIEDLNTIESDFLNRVMAEKTIIAISNKNEIIPVKDLTKNTLVVSIDNDNMTDFQKMAANYTQVSTININSSKIDSTRLKSDLETIQNAGNLIVGLHLSNIRPGAKYGVNSVNQAIINEISKRKDAILVVFGNIYALDKYENIDAFDGLILTGQLSKYTEEAAAMAVFGGIDISGRLPASINEKYKLNDGINVSNIGRLSYGIPEMAGLDSKIFNRRIDSVLNLGLKEKAYPGAVMQVAKNGRVIYQKAVGFHTFEQADQNEKVLRAKPDFEKGNQSDVMDNPNNLTAQKQLKSNGTIPKGTVRPDDIYDFASVTKTTTAGLAIMQMASEGKFDINKTFADYYPEFKGSNKENLTFKDMLTHRAGLKAFIPFWVNCVDSIATLQKAVELHPGLENDFLKTYKKQNFFQKLLKKAPKYTIEYAQTLKTNKNIWNKAVSAESIAWKPGIFSNIKSDEYAIEITDSMFLNKNYVQEIMKQIKESPVNPAQGYVYSDLHYMTYPFIIPTITGKDMETYLKETYRVIGAYSLTYNPKKQFSLDRIVPTEKDILYRKTLVHGYVHDEAAGMIGGVSGHAGLFGNANDLSKLLQLYLQKGYFGGKQFIKPEIVDNFTEYQFPFEGNRRGIAFDKLDFNKKISNGPQLASSKSYGHSGFTGTFYWVDPQYDLTYVFLSNRVYPTRDNNKIGSLNIRTEVGNQIIKTIKGK
ncbi:MAG: serine hydrolase [Cytophagaceae bacterium]|nr:serine hydrolase [Cytophagaceae bacterium]